VNCPATSFTSIAIARSRLATQLRQLFASDFTVNNRRRVIRLEAPLTDCSPLEWLSWQNHPQQIYWSDRQLAFEVAGVGCADYIRCDNGQEYERLLQGLGRQLDAQSGQARYYGGIRFNSGAEVDEHWLPYGNCAFILPQFEVFAAADGACLACNVLLDAGEHPGQKLRFLLKALEQIRLEQPLQAASDTFAYLSRTDIPDRAEWLRTVETALDILQTGKLDKVVLSRSTALTFAHSPNPLLLLKRLKDIEPFAYHFYLQPARGYAFLGATPERLFKRQRNLIHSEALAGTCGRGTTPVEDVALGEALLRSEKEYHEHRIVLDDIKAILEQHCRYLAISETPQLMKQSKVQHIYSLLEGRLLDTVADVELLRLLHPTPAVGGLPRDKALLEIAALEPFDRGWFAGPVGWIGHDATEFAVGIRSAIVHDRSLRLFAGAGIVEGSVPELEWQEIETKISVFMDALGIQ